MTRLKEQNELLARLRESYRLVFSPDEGEAATDVDRRKVLADIAEYCCVDRAFPVDPSADIATQHVAYEGRRTVYLRIAEAIRIARQVRLKKTESYQARTE